MGAEALLTRMSQVEAYWYDVLGVSRDADAKQIESVYKIQALEWHQTSMPTVR
jgi:DnaJ-class molecular chaperone